MQQAASVDQTSTSGHKKMATIQIDLKDIMADEYGDDESLAQSIHRQVVDQIAARLAATARKSVDDEISKAVREALRAAMADQIPALVKGVLEDGYRPVDRLGNPGEPLVLRDEIIKIAQDELTYRAPDHYNGGQKQNLLTTAVLKIAGEQLREFQQTFTTQVTAKFMDDAMTYARAEMAKRLGVK
jgi:hypothetical protein